MPPHRPEEHLQNDQLLLRVLLRPQCRLAGIVLRALRDLRMGLPGVLRDEGLCERGTVLNNFWYDRVRKLVYGV